MKGFFKVSSFSEVLGVYKVFPVVKMQILKEMSYLPDLNFLHSINTFIEHVCLFQRSSHSYSSLVIIRKLHFN